MNKAILLAVAAGLVAPTVGIAAKPTRPNPNAAIIARAKAAVARDMKDPGSVQFRNVRVYRHDEQVHVCGEFNAKNGYGGYVGFQPFVSDGNFASTDSDGIRFEVMSHFCQE